VGRGNSRPSLLMARRKKEKTPEPVIVELENKPEVISLDADPEPALSELDTVEEEMRLISPTLKTLKTNDQEQYEKVYRRYMWLVERRTELQKGPA
jgi:hypothetical protein